MSYNSYQQYGSSQGYMNGANASSTSQQPNPYSDTSMPWQSSSSDQQATPSTTSAAPSNTSTNTNSATSNIAPTMWNPTLATAAASAVLSGGASPSNEALWGVGIQAGKEFLDKGTAQMIPGLERTMTCLRVYFAVDNGYVKRKIGRVLFSFLHKRWRRVETESGAGKPPTYSLPINDDNAPDLYIPSMSLITYVLLCALSYGTVGKFNPEVLSDVTTKCFFTQLLEVLFFRFGIYLMQAPTSFLDLFSITGYKYLGLALNMLVGNILSTLLPQLGYGTTAYYITFLWTGFSTCYFVLKSMSNHIPTVTAKAGPKRELMVLGFACSQFATMWFLGQTKFLQ